MNEESKTYEWNPKIACRTIEDTAFILFQSRMVSLNEVGTFVWDHFKEISSIDKAAYAVLEEFDTTHEEAVKDVEGFVLQLVERDLLVERCRTASA